MSLFCRHLIFCCQVRYSLRRLTAYQTQNLYVGPQYDIQAPDLNPLFPGVESKPDPIKGGLRVTGFFTYNCLAVSLSAAHTHLYLKTCCMLLNSYDLQDSKDIYSECLRTFWTCPNCDLYMPLTPLERMQHEASCRPAGEQEPEDGWEDVSFLLIFATLNTPST